MRFHPAFGHGSALVLAACTAALSCAKTDATPPPPASAGALPAAAPPGSGAPGAPPAAPIAPTTCTVSPEKVWDGSANATAGLTQTVLDGGRVAFGVVVAGRPDVLVFDDKGEGKLAAPAVKKALTTPLGKDQGKREILRVTPAVGSGGQVLAFVDYRETEGDRRLVKCGPSDSAKELLAFDGKPLVDLPDEAEKPAPVESAKPRASKFTASRPKLKSVNPSVVAEALKRRELRRIGGPGAGSAATPERAAAEPAPPKPKADKVRELRDCRTVVDRGGAHVWAVGSELVGQPLEEGGTNFSMVFFAEQEGGRGRTELHTFPLGKEPKKLSTYEAPVAIDLGAGGFAVATRFRGSILAWLLDPNKKSRAPTRIFVGASPQPPRFALLGQEPWLLAVTADGTNRLARAARFVPNASVLPPELTDLRLDDREVTGSLAPAMAGDRRFLAYQSGDARRLSLAAVDAGLARTGAPLFVDAGVQESALVPLADGRLLLVYLRAAASRLELVSRTATCT